jgi:hypothetical protein
MFVMFNVFAVSSVKCLQRDNTTHREESNDK